MTVIPLSRTQMPRAVGDLPKLSWDPNYHMQYYTIYGTRTPTTSGPFELVVRSPTYCQPPANANKCEICPGIGFKTCYLGGD